MQALLRNRGDKNGDSVCDMDDKLTQDAALIASDLTMQAEDVWMDKDINPIRYGETEPLFTD